MSLLKGTQVIAHATQLPQGNYTFSFTAYSEKEDNPILDKKGFVQLSGYIAELKATHNIMLFENNLAFTLSELKSVYFPNDDVTDIEILDNLVGAQLPIWVTLAPNPQDASKPFTNINFKKPLSVQANDLMAE